MLSFFISLILFLINGLSVLRFYQIKDYLYKKVVAHFYLPTSKKILLGYKEIILYFLVFLGFVLSFFNDIYLNLKPDFLIFLLILFFVLRFNLLKKVHFTQKAIIVSFLVFLFNFLLLYAFNNHLLIFLLLLPWVSQFLFFTLSIKIFDFCVRPYLKFLGRKVKEKIEKNKENGLKIIGICGSYGKSGTKEILTQILKEKYKVLSLPPRINHEYAILKFLLKVDLKNYDYLILEFGSYFLGNIKFITKYIVPDIAFITGITKQHLYLFGNIKNIITGEGIEILTWIKKGTVFVNNNHEYWGELKQALNNLKTNDIKIFSYGLNADFSYKILENDLEKTKFLFIGSKEYIFQTNLIFPMQVENLVGALSFISLIDDPENFKEKIKNIKLPEGFLKLKRKDNFYIFDDSYNANPRGVFSALEYFQNLDFNYKIIIFNGLFELGKETKEVYEKLKEEFMNFDKVILISEDFFEIIKISSTKEGLVKIKDKFLLISSQKELEIFLKSLNFEKVGIWIINRFPERFKINL